jgi:transcriptional regulator with XRE-family HTH domain
MSIFSTKLKQLRKAKGFSQDELAEAIGVHKSHVSRYERGLAVPSIEVAKKIADTLNVALDHLVFEHSQINNDRELNKLFEQVSKLDEDKKSIVKELLSAFIFKVEVQGKLA